MANQVTAAQTYRETPSPSLKQSGEISKAVGVAAERLKHLSEKEMLQDTIQIKDRIISGLEAEKSSLEATIAELREQILDKDKRLKSNQELLREKEESSVSAIKANSLQNALEVEKEKVEKLVEKLNQQSQTIKESTTIQTSMEAEVIFLQGALALEREKVEQLEKKFPVKTVMEEAADVFKPTAYEMELELKRLEPLATESKQLLETVDNLRSKLQRFCETKDMLVATLEAEIRQAHVEFYNLGDKYLKIKPAIEEAETALEMIIEASRHPEIQEVYNNAFSAQNSLGISVMKKNRTAFLLQHELCNEQKEFFRTDLGHFLRRFGDITGHMNKLLDKFRSKKGTAKAIDSVPGLNYLLSTTFYYTSPTAAGYKREDINTIIPKQPAVI